MLTFGLAGQESGCRLWPLPLCPKFLFSSPFLGFKPLYCSAEVYFSIPMNWESGHCDSLRAPILSNTRRTIYQIPVLGCGSGTPGDPAAPPSGQFPSRMSLAHPLSAILSIFRFFKKNYY